MSVAAVACRDRTGHAYEITLELARDSAPFAAVGERCGYRLAQLADRVRAARHDPEQAALWPDPDDRFPAPAGLHDYQPGESQYFALRSRDRGDLAGDGELRCMLRSSADWIGECGGAAGPGGSGGPGGSAAPGGSAGPGAGGPFGRYQVPRQRAWPGVRAVLGQQHLPGQPPGSVRREPGRLRHGAPGGGCWRLTRRAVIEAWGRDGIGVRAVLTSAELVTFLDTVLTEPGGSALVGTAPVGGAAASGQQGLSTSRVQRERGRLPDGSSRSRLPALRAKARGVAVAERDPQARRGDVRR